MDTSTNPLQWSDREWLAFLLIAAADADDDHDIHELRFARVGLGKGTVDAMTERYMAMGEEARNQILRESLPQRLPTLKSREKVQKLLRQMVLADGEYGPEEQALVKRISGWLRGGI